MFFTQLKSSCIPIPVAGIKIDQIIPTRLLKVKDGFAFGEKLFYDWRYDEEDRLDASFALNNPEYSGSILLVGNNFGKGINAEPAILSMLDYGFKVIISSFFASSFKNTALSLGLIPIELPEAILNDLMIAVHANPRIELSIDVKTQRLEVVDLNLSFKFKLNTYQMLCQMHACPQMNVINGALAIFKLKGTFPV